MILYFTILHDKPSYNSQHVLYSNHSTNNVGELRSLMTSAFLGPLAPPQQQQLINDLKNDPKSVAHSLLSPHKVRDLY